MIKLRTPNMNGCIAAMFALAAAACAPEDQTPRTDIVHGKSLYAASCAQCHGENGEGAGPESLGLGSPPPSLRNLSRDNGGVYPRDYVMATIDGLSRHTQLTAAMPEFGAGDLGPVVQIEQDGLSMPVPSDLLALANYLETLQDE